jgi:hypothetical protein
VNIRNIGIGMLLSSALLLGLSINISAQESGTRCMPMTAKDKKAKKPKNSPTPRPSPTPTA